jgi:hypothetical protein
MVLVIAAVGNVISVVICFISRLPLLISEFVNVICRQNCILLFHNENNSISDKVIIDGIHNNNYFSAYGGVGFSCESI